jgi:uncharacterized repeat protein (TIGR01451 family)
VLITDESVQGSQVDQATAAQSLVDSAAVLFSVVDLAAANTQGYRDLATGSGGQAFEIDDFRTDPSTVMAALTAQCIQVVQQRSVDLAVTVTDSVEQTEAGSAIQYTVTLSNVGGSDITDAGASLTLPTGVTFVSADGSGVHQDGVVTWPATWLAAGTSVTYTVAATAPATVTAETTLSAQAVATTGETETSTLNNQAIDTTLIPYVAPSPTPTPQPEKSLPDGGAEGISPVLPVVGLFVLIATAVIGLLRRR